MQHISLSLRTIGIGLAVIFVPLVVLAATTISVGTEQTFSNDGAQEKTLVKLTATSALLLYRDYDDGNDGVARIITKDGNTLTASAKTIFSTGAVTSFDAARLSATGVVIGFADSAGKVTIADIDGSSVSFTTPQQVTTSSDDVLVEPYGGTGVIVAYRDGSDSNKGKVRLGKIGTTAITFDSPVTFETNATSMQGMVALSDDTYVVLYIDTSTSNRGEAVAIDTSSGTPSAGTAVNLTSSSIIQPSIVPADSNSFVAVYRDLWGSNDGEARLGTVAGTTITLQSAVKYDDNYIQDTASTNFGSGTVLVSAYDLTDFNLYLGTINGSTLSFASPVAYESSASKTAMVSFTDTSGMVAYIDGGMRTIDLVATDDSADSNTGGGAAAHRRIRQRYAEIAAGLHGSADERNDTEVPDLSAVGIFVPGTGSTVEESAPTYQSDTLEEPMPLSRRSQKVVALLQEEKEEEELEDQSAADTRTPFEQRVCERVLRRFSDSALLRVDARVERRLGFSCL